MDEDGEDLTRDCGRWGYGGHAAGGVSKKERSWMS